MSIEGPGLGSDALRTRWLAWTLPPSAAVTVTTTLACCSGWWKTVSPKPRIEPL
jgi:hypothetical protein